MRRFVLVAAVMLAGCVSGSATPAPNIHLAPQPVEHVELLFHKPDRAYAVVGVVDAHGDVGLSSEKFYAKLRKEGAQLGADAVLVTDATTYSGGTYQLTGVAVKWE